MDGLNSTGIAELPLPVAKVLGKTAVADIVLKCMDFRFNQKLRHAIRTHFGIKEWDLIAIAGGPYSLIRPQTNDKQRLKIWEAAQTTVFDGFEIAINLHGAERAILCDHEKCGAVARDGHKFSKFDAEQQFHFDMLAQACDVVTERFSNIKVQTSLVYVDRGGLIQVKSNTCKT